LELRRKVTVEARKGYGPKSVRYVAFPSLHEPPLMISARLSIPNDERDEHPAVLLLHGTAGPSLREGGYADLLNEAGFATLEPDQWTARGLVGGAASKPGSVLETLPDVFGARQFLCEHPAVDDSKIGVLGFSFGGAAVMLCANRRLNEQYPGTGRFAASIALYPGVWSFNHLPGYEFENLVDTPLMMVTGDLDQFDDDPDIGPKFVEGLAEEDRRNVRAVVMRESHHGFDMPGVEKLASDPMSHRGAGGAFIMSCNPSAMNQSRGLAVEFFLSTLGG